MVPLKLMAYRIYPKYWDTLTSYSSFVLKLEQVQFITSWCVQKKAGWEANNVNLVHMEWTNFSYTQWQNNMSIMFMKLSIRKHFLPNKFYGGYIYTANSL